MHIQHDQPQPFRVRASAHRRTLKNNVLSAATWERLHFITNLLGQEIIFYGIWFPLQRKIFNGDEPVIPVLQPRCQHYLAKQKSKYSRPGYLWQNRWFRNLTPKMPQVKLTRCSVSNHIGRIPHQWKRVESRVRRSGRERTLDWGNIIVQWSRGSNGCGLKWVKALRCCFSPIFRPQMMEILIWVLYFSAWRQQSPPTVPSTHSLAVICLQPPRKRLN